MTIRIRHSQIYLGWTIWLLLLDGKNDDLQALLPLLQRAASHVQGDEFSISRAAILNISSTGGSVTMNTAESPFGGSSKFKILGYKATKVIMSLDLRNLTIRAPNKLSDFTSQSGCRQCNLPFGQAILRGLFRV